jgi:two-component system OmpR family sensor kinase
MTGGRSLRQGVPLRLTLVGAILLLVTLALVLAGVAGTTALRTSLLDQVDDGLAASSRGAVDRAEHGRLPDLDRPPLDDEFRPAPSAAFFLLRTDATGAGTGELQAPEGSAQHAPRLPALTAEEVDRRADEPFTVPDTGGAADWRVLVRPLTDGGAVTVASSLEDVEDTVARLRTVSLLVGLAVLLLLGVLGDVLVRSSLRRLVQVETTAEAIAAGDLSRRVPGAGGRSEVGRLAAAFNTMVDRIETAFAARRESEASARRSEERMRRFVADASHELRTPLTSIRGFAELYRQGAVADPAEVGRAMARIESEADRMGLLVEDLLLLARLDQQRPLERLPVDLLVLAADAVHDAGAQDPGRPVRLEVAAGDAPPVVLGDEARLRQVLANLVGNALTHTPPGTPVTVGVATRDGGESAGSAVVEVSDTGRGLEPDQAARVFERFYRTDPARTRAHGGAGLGLSIVQALVAAHGGTVEVETAPGAGATFRVTLPLSPAPDPAPAADPVPADRAG